MASLAGAAVGAVLGAVTKNVVAQVFKIVEKRSELSKNLPNDVDYIKRELLMIAGAEEDQLSGKGDPRVVRSISMEEMRDLAHDIEDCLDRILCYAESKRDPSLLQLFMAVNGPSYAREIEKLKERLRAAHQRKHDYNVNGNQQAATSSAFPAITEVEPVGIDKPKRDIIELLNDVEGQPEHLKVISIVGIGGSGKSTLAKSVYGCPDVRRRFPCRAWVPASEHRVDIMGLLTALLEKLRPGEPVWGDQQQLQHNITNFLNTARCLIVLDGIEEQQWYHIRSTFPEKTRSKIIVTTTAQAVGKVCSHDNSHVYNMTTLNMNHSTELLEAVLKGHSPGLEQNSAPLVKKCDGHPLALVSVANYLLRENVLTKRFCEQFCQSLGYHMANKHAFSKLQQVLLTNYSNLPGNPLKTCLLYICVFPNGHTISSNSLMKRWLAEGYVQHQHPRSALLIADENFKELIDRNILRKIDSSKSAKVKTCRVHGIMHEFMLHLAISAKFITSLGDPKRSNYRHLFFENPSSGKAPDIKHCHTSQASSSSSREKFRARSLTICGSAGDAVADFAKYELLRVLDLEECNDLEDDHMNGLHKLWHLKYLSLGATISKLPRNFKKLHCLETLDLRKTKIETLPLEIVKLPHLTHLLGKFKILFGKKDLKMNEAHKFFLKESNLQTLAGFVADDNPVFSTLMAHLKKLRKVKIWYNSSGEDSKSLTDLSTAINKFIQDELDTSVGVRSLSLDLGSSMSNILHSLDYSYGYLSSLKLHGALSGLTGFATSLCGLTELCLSSTNNLMSNDLSNLSKLKHLEYLKLVKVSLGGFVIRRRDFPRLVRLCIVQSPTLPTIKEGAMPKLISLQLLCEDLVGLAGIAIEWHKHLQEVALDSMVSSETITMWENSAKKHPKRPRVLFLRKLGPDVLKYVTTERPSPETDCPIVRGKREIHEVQQNLVIDLDSALKRIKFSGPSMTSPELPSARNDAMPSSSRAVS